jgi:allantoate deiminase
VSTAISLATEMRIPFRRMSSGAAHDTMVFARAGVPSLLVFVPSRHGVSHSPEEFTSPEDLATGFKFMGELVARIAKRRA